MKLTFIKPSIFGKQSTDALNPLVISILAALTPENIELEFFDERIEKIPQQLNANVIVMTVETFVAKRAYSLADQFKKQGIKIIMGGVHPTMLPEESLNHADCVIIGDAEDVWIDVINDLQNNMLKTKYVSTNKAAPLSVTSNRNIFAGKKYNKIGIVQYGRGCKFKCDFCTVNAFYGSNIRHKNLQDLIKEIKQLKEDVFLFVDDNLFVNEKNAIELFEALIPIKKKWICQISIDLAKNDNLLKRMKQSGCIMVIIGFESLNVNNLKQIGKAANYELLKNNYKEVIKKIYDNGLMIYSTFVIGYDNDTKDTFNELLSFALECKFVVANFNPLIPIPGTRLYYRLKTEGRLIYDKWWLDNNYKYGDAMFYPAQMTPYELTEGCKMARMEFNRYSNIFNRMLNFKSNASNAINLYLYILTNLISRTEIYKKQGQYL